MDVTGCRPIIRAGDREELANVAVTLAGMYLTPATIEELTSEEDMIIYWDEDTVAGQAIIEKHAARRGAEARDKGLEEGQAEGRARGQAEGRAEGRAEGCTDGRAEVYARLMARTFGEDPRIPALAERLARVPQDRAIELATAAESLDDLEASLS